MYKRVNEKKFAIKLRKQGLTYNEILKKINVAKGSLSLWLRDVELNNKQKNRIKQLRIINGQKLVKWRKDCSDNKLISSKAGKKAWKLHRNKLIKNLIHDGSVNLYYRKDELSIKLSLEKMFKTSFNKEKICNKYIDFADKKYLIEHTFDITKGVQDAILRLRSVPLNDKRKKIIITHKDKIGKLRALRCVDNNIEVLDIKKYQSIV